MLGEVRPRAEAEGCGAVAAAQAAGMGRARLKAGGQGTRGAHSKHVPCCGDLGHVQAQRLVERIRTLPSQKAGMRCGTRCGPGGGQVWGGSDARSVQGRARLQIGWKARGGAHVEHLVHALHAGGVEGQRLVERRCALPRVKRRACGTARGKGGHAMRDEVRPGRRAGVGRQRRTQRAREGAAAD